MRTWTAALVSTLILSSATSAFAAKKAGKGDFGDLFAAVDKAGNKPSRAQHAARTPAPKAKLAPKAAAAHPAAKPSAPMVAQNTPNPENVLVLMDYAPDRHAWAGP
ncbi:MAG: hypothetical protein JST54_15975 [Deltaproteobacteria bacterium]|nr:hypothetical protein [Deltaproteobacteria bacterium]